MPLFFILSGMFLSVDKYTIYEFAFKRAKQLLLPAFYFTIITILIRYPIGHLDLTTFSSGLPGVLWFLPILYLSQLIILVLFKIFPSKTYRTGLVCILFVLAFFLNENNIPYSIITSVVASAFVGSGYMLNNNHIIKINSTSRNICKAILLFTLLFILDKVYNVCIDMRLNVLSPFAISLGTSFIGTLMVIRWSMLIEKVKNGGGFCAISE